MLDIENTVRLLSPMTQGGEVGPWVLCCRRINFPMEKYNLSNIMLNSMQSVIILHI